jgi:anti-sigma regulatory factor (Ser/Thr protein kinase)
MISTLTLAGSPSSPSSARRHIADVLRGWKVCSEETVETTRLVVSELVTNAIRHPGTAAGSLPSGPEAVGTVELVLEATDSVVRISVRDRDPHPPRLKEAGVEAPGGRGIFLVANLSTRWGHCLCRPEPGKVVWAEVPLLSESSVGSSRSLAATLPAPSALPPEPGQLAEVDLRNNRTPPPVRRPASSTRKPFSMNTRHVARRPTHRSGEAQSKAQSSGSQRNAVPFVARWSGERDADMPMVFRRGQRGIGYANERSFDRDPYGILWSRTPSQPGRGVPQYGKVHSLRQRLCMTGLRCQVCGGPADHTAEGVLWLLDAPADDLRPGAEHTAHPPVCRPCAHQAVRSCVHLRARYVAVRASAFTYYGVQGAVYQATLSGPRVYDAAAVRLGDPRLSWTRASQLLMTLTDFTVIDLSDPTA